MNKDEPLQLIGLFHKMFGSKLKTWMENYIGRAKKKEVQKEKIRRNEKGGTILESSESLTYKDTGITSSQQVFSSSANNKGEKYSKTTVESERNGMILTNTAISLPSPESAYSTGYSTDGASPGATGPPEYYINIRTGKHYFPSPAPTPTSTQPENPLLRFGSGNQHLTSPLVFEDSSLPSRPVHYSHNERELSSSISSSSSAKSRLHTSFKNSDSFLQEVDPFVLKVQGSMASQNTLSSPQSSHSVISKSLSKKFPSKTQLSSLKLFLKSPRNEREKTKRDINKTPTPENKKKLTSNGKPKKWFKQPFHRIGQQRTDSCDEKRLESEPKKEMHFEKNFSYRLGHENSASPRQRNRIKTNPWLPIEPLSSQNFPTLNFSPRLTRNHSCSNTPLQTRKISQPSLFQDRILQLNSKYEESRDYLDGLEKAVNRHLRMELSDHSEEDLTLNEMMGTYSESYVYEKETDILSDSDPTDCEDYVTDSEANNGGDERDSHDDELDFIDNGSVIESDDKFPRNTGKCAYYDTPIKKNFFLFKIDRRHSRKGSDCRKNSKKDQDLKSRKEKRRHLRKSFKRDDENLKMGLDKKMRQKFEIDENIGRINLDKILAQRIMSQKVSKYSEKTPEVENSREVEKELWKFHSGKVKASAETGVIQSDILVNLILDSEADIRYKELIKEAENIFESIQNSPGNKTAKRKDLLNTENRGFVEVATDAVKNTENTAHSQVKPKESDTSVKKSSKELDLKLFVETPKKPRRLEIVAKNQNSLRTKTSGHSPLDPLGPTLRNFAIFSNPYDERKMSMNFFKDSKNEKSLEFTRQERKCGFVRVPPVVPFAFQSLDLGKPLTSYCPQSEPVKRKIYTCSKTYDKLVKQLDF